MLEARIIAPRGSLYYAGEATPYDLETLRQHLRECKCALTSDVTLELTVEDGPAEAVVTDWLGGITSAGYQVRVRRPQRGAV
jgi:hypothetical protein